MKLQITSLSVSGTFWKSIYLTYSRRLHQNNHLFVEQQIAQLGSSNNCFIFNLYFRTFPGPCPPILNCYISQDAESPSRFCPFRRMWEHMPETPCKHYPFIIQDVCCIAGVTRHSSWWWFPLLEEPAILGSSLGTRSMSYRGKINIPLFQQILIVKLRQTDHNFILLVSSVFWFQPKLNFSWQLGIRESVLFCHLIIWFLFSTYYG